MSIVVLNPNTDRAMTDAVVASLGSRMPAAVRLHGMTARLGCAVIDSPETFDIGARTAVSMLAGVPRDAVAILLACFGDPGLARMRAATATPVIGLAEAAIRRALDEGDRFAILTAGTAWVPMLRACAFGHGAGDLLAGVYPLSGNGAALRRDPQAFAAQVDALCRCALDDGARAVILGGAAFAGLRIALPPGLRSIDSFEAAARALSPALSAASPTSPSSSSAS